MTTIPITLKPAKVELPKIDVEKIPRRPLSEKIQAELEACKDCDGNCPKTNRYCYPVLTDGYEREIGYVQCKFGRQLELERKFRSSKIPARYLGKTFADYTVDDQNRKAVKFAKNALKSNRGAYFFGECGTGKTFLASIIAQEFLRDGKSVIFVKVPSVLDDLRSTFDGKGNELDLLDELRAANLVVLDDFGMEKSTQWAGSTLCKILDMRYDNPQAVTIVTSNLSLEELAAHLNNPEKESANLNGSRIADRLREICKPFLFKGITRRN